MFWSLYMMMITKISCVVLQKRCGTYFILNMFHNNIQNHVSLNIYNSHRNLPEATSYPGQNTSRSASTPQTCPAYPGYSEAGQTPTASSGSARRRDTTTESRTRRPIASTCWYCLLRPGMGRCGQRIGCWHIRGSSLRGICILLLR